MLQIEIIVKNADEAKLAEQYSADVLELIHDFSEGGLSPTRPIAKIVCEAAGIPVYVMVRPHGKSFIYNEQDKQFILDEITYLRNETNAFGIVFGALMPDGHIDTDLLESVIATKGHLALTFHRAIDSSRDPIESYKTLLNYPAIDRVLTSGGKDTAAEGAEILQQFVTLNNNRGYATVLAGSGINLDNALALIKQTSVTAIHIGTGVREAGLLDKAQLKKLSFLKNH